jgi:ABC-type antimicrobial peptide transport system permease subunit
VAIINEAMAARYWPRGNPLGGIFHLKGRAVRVVGVAKMANYDTLLEVPKLFYYVPLEQFPAGAVVLHVRATLPPGAMAAALAREVHALDPGVAPSQLFTMREYVAIKSDAQTVALTLVGIFGGLALLLATIGLYGVMSYAVSQRTREIGIRIALGARRREVTRRVVGRGLALTAVAVLLGIAGAAALSRVLVTLLVGVKATDAATFAGAAVLMGAVSFLAAYLPARRASRLDPLSALAEE